jgi:pyruvate dehydrogenase E2 component (dihydrolipoamide acetyltransferase)
VDLATVSGTGPGGKVTRADVAAAATAAPAPAVRPGEVVPLSAMRRIVAERMALSKQTIPCYYLTMDVDMTEAACLRAKLNQKANGQPKVSFNDFLLKACGRALKQFPAVNSRWVEGGLERRGAANVGLAVALEEGLMVPVVRDADAKDLRQIARETADLAQRARSKRLVPDEYQDGCMTVTNLGMFGIRDFIPVVNPGESCIMGVGVIQDRVVFRQGGIQVRQMMTITLAVDHRIVDGAVAAQFLETVRDLLESPQPLAKG